MFETVEEDPHFPTPQPIIQLENVSVSYRLPSERIETFKEYAIRKLQRKIKITKFWALTNVNLQINKGEVFGLIGNNGAGKSTMLKVISKVLKPTKGRVVVFGKIAPLLELGAGFHPELSGGENVFLNGALLGYSRSEMESVFNEIVNSPNWNNSSTPPFALTHLACLPGLDLLWQLPTCPRS